VAFATAFPNLVDRLVLLAPAGLIRSESFGLASRIAFQSGIIPDRILSILTRKRLQQPISNKKLMPSRSPSPHGEVSQAKGKEVNASRDGHHLPVPPAHEKEDFVDVAVAEVVDPKASSSISPLQDRVMHYVRWMVASHDGFVPAFMSCIRYGPLTDQHDTWKLLSQRKPGTIAILVGRDDEILEVDQFSTDALSLVGGEDHVYWRVMTGGHDFVMTHPKDIMEELGAFWKR
jgi:pimeloyl-ACP methyl ester carboxylesterase